MSKPEKYTLISIYEIRINKDKNMRVYFFKFAGMYLTYCKCDMLASWKYFMDRDILCKSIKELKRVFYAKKIHFNSNIKHAINLQEFDSGCFFACAACEPVLCARDVFWDKDDGFIRCENEGIKLDIDYYKILGFNNYGFHINIDELVNKCIQDTKTFIKFIFKFTLRDQRLIWYCDECDEEHIYTDIYFCKSCEENYNNNILSKNSYLYDNFNLCKKCFNTCSVDKHLVKFPGHTEFILKEKNLFSYFTPEGNELIDTIGFSIF